MKKQIVVLLLCLGLSNQQVQTFLPKLGTSVLVASFCYIGANWILTTKRLHNKAKLNFQEREKTHRIELELQRVGDYFMMAYLIDCSKEDSELRRALSADIAAYKSKDIPMPFLKKLEKLKSDVKNADLDQIDRTGAAKQILLNGLIAFEEFVNREMNKPKISV